MITIKSVDKNNIVSIDKTSIDVNAKPSKGWVLKGTKCILQTKTVKRDRRSLLFAINRERTIKHTIVKGSINGEIYRDFIMNKIVPQVNNNLLLMDNARIHHYKKLKNDISGSTNKIVYNVPYSPELNPIECVNNKVKSDLIKCKCTSTNINNQIEKVLMKQNNFSAYFDKSFGVY